MENNKIDISVDSFKEALTCGICQEIATLPVHGVCCENAKSMFPGCLSCVRYYYELNKPINRRSAYSKKSYNGCGCNVNIDNRRSESYYCHTTQLDMIRNLLGPSKCPNAGCNVSCSTTAELRRHLNGLISPNDKFLACIKAFTKCNYCGFYGKREFIEGKHFEQNHAFIQCTVCWKEVMRENALGHYNNHKYHLSLLKDKITALGLK
jgi:hypothetical protein